MPKKIKYDPRLRETDHGRRLYTYWKKVRLNTDSAEFETFDGFYKWAQDAGYSVGSKLIRLDARAPFNPDNCVWIYHEQKEEKAERDPNWERIWDETVNRIRLHYGMEPVGTSEV